VSKGGLNKRRLDLMYFNAMLPNRGMRAKGATGSPFNGFSKNWVKV